MVADASKLHRPPRRHRCAATSLAAVATLLLALVALAELLTPRSQPGASSATATTIRISLRARFSELGAATAVTQVARRGAPRQRSHYQQWVEHDFHTWAETGITPEMVTRAATARTFRGVPPVRCVARLGAAAAPPLLPLLAAAERSYTLSTPALAPHSRMSRFQIVDGVLWADYPPAAQDNAWASEPGWISAKGRIPATLLQLADLLHSRPGAVGAACIQ